MIKESEYQCSFQEPIDAGLSRCCPENKIRNCLFFPCIYSLTAFKWLHSAVGLEQKQ